MKLQKWLLTRYNPRVASARALPVLNHQRFTSSATPSTNRHRPLEPLQDGNIDYFREKCFVPGRPTILPRQFFRDIPAVERWFRPGTTQNDTPRLRLNIEYLEQHGPNAFVPLELTQPSTSESTNSELSFRQFHAPLSLFLQWMQTAETNPQQSTRLYLAQCQLSDLPQILRDDFPVPNIVTRAGRGDVYDANVWIGHPPTYTPLHRDPNPNLFVQMAGGKVVRLVSPDDGLGLFATVRRQLGRSGNREAAAIRGEEMMQGPERALLEKVVWGDADTQDSDKEWYEVCLGPGDGLFIPKGWWHSIKGVGEGVTASVSLSIAVRED